MRKIVVTEFVTLNGIMDEPAWTFPYWNDEIASFKAEESLACDALLLGRVTYDGFARAWPESKDEGADQINGLPKYVATTTLEKADWNNTTLIKENVLEEIVNLKQQPGQNILVYGSATLVDFLLKANLVDEYRLLVYPVIKGSGKRLFKDGADMTLKLVNSKTFSNGVLALVYRTAEKEGVK